MQENLTLSFFNESEIYIADIVRDACTQLDSSIIWATILILTMYIFKTVIIPRAVIGLEEFFLLAKLQPDVIVSMIEWVSDRFDTVGLASAIFLVVFAWLQYEVTFLQKLWLTILGVFVIIALIPIVLEWFGGKKEKPKKSKIEWNELE